jgi:hypothetical protein
MSDWYGNWTLLTPLDDPLATVPQVARGLSDFQPAPPLAALRGGVLLTKTPTASHS